MAAGGTRFVAESVETEADGRWKQRKKRTDGARQGRGRGREQRLVGDGWKLIRKG